MNFIIEILIEKTGCKNYNDDTCILKLFLVLFFKANPC